VAQGRQAQQALRWRCPGGTCSFGGSRRGRLAAATLQAFELLLELRVFQAQAFDFVGLRGRQRGEGERDCRIGFHGRAVLR
jgi:hypothetical protein